MYTLGINAVYHDSAACIVKDGQVIAAAEEERFTRVKHAKRPVPFSAYELPFFAIDYCLKTAGIGLRDLDHVAYSYDPYLVLKVPGSGCIDLPLQPSAVPSADGQSPWDPLLLSYVVNAPRQLRDGYPHRLHRSFAHTEESPSYTWHFVDHHTAHEASAFLPSPFDEAAILTMDGRGEAATTTYAIGAGNYIERLTQVDMPHSLGLLYEEVTRYLGFLHSSDEYKVMALASAGAPRYRSYFRELVQLQGEGHYRIGPLDLQRALGAARAPGDPITQKHRDVACSLQNVLEETVLELAHWLHSKTSMDALCMAGGVALNCVLTARLQREGPFREIWVQPAAGDAGTALGAALWVDGAVRGEEARRYVMNHNFLGSAFDDREIERLLRWSQISYRPLQSVDEAAELLAEDKVLGWFQGHMEYGPRALGGRSILASPLNSAMQGRLNEIKGREDFRPVAPAVLEEMAGEWFEGCDSSPFMLFVYPVAADRRHRIPAVAHVDGTARVQTVTKARNGLFYDLIRAFESWTGVPLLINTSFNLRGGPIVCSPRDALECFYTSPLDALVIGSFILEKDPRDVRAHIGSGANLRTSSSA